MVRKARKTYETPESEELDLMVENVLLDTQIDPVEEDDWDDL